MYVFKTSNVTDF